MMALFGQAPTLFQRWISLENVGSVKGGEGKAFLKMEPFFFLNPFPATVPQPHFHAPPPL